MPKLEISELTDAGEARWGVRLTDGVVLLASTTPVTKGAAHAAAKSLRSKGSEAAVVAETPGNEPDAPVWIIEKSDEGAFVRFSLVRETMFQLPIKPEDAGSPKAIEEALFSVKVALGKAEIEWNPPEADPAYEMKETELTPTVGWPGS